jgi:hypothetical protein
MRAEKLQRNTGKNIIGQINVKGSLTHRNPGTLYMFQRSILITFGPLKFRLEQM